MCHVFFKKNVPIIEEFSERKVYAARWNARIKIE